MLVGPTLDRVVMSGESEKWQEIGGAQVEPSVSSENEMARVHHRDFSVLKYGATHTPVSCQLVILAQLKKNLCNSVFSSIKYFSS